MGRGTLGTSRGIAAATSTAAPGATNQSSGSSQQAQRVAKKLGKLHKSLLTIKRVTYRVGDNTAVLSSTMGRSGLEYLVQTSTSNGAAQTHRSSDFSEIKAIAKKHLGV